MNLFICFLSGIATSLGYFFCYLKIEKNKLIASTLAFASSIMFFMSLLELIPEGIAIIKAHYMMPTSILMISLFFTIGILIALSINNIIKNITAQENHIRIFRILLSQWLQSGKCLLIFFIRQKSDKRR